MAGKGRITVLILVIAAFAAMGCTLPEGIIGEGIATSAVYNDLLINPIRLVYEINQKFEQDSRNLEVFINNRDGKTPVPLDECEIRIIHDPAKPDDYNVVPLIGGYPFTTKGTKLIWVKYTNLSGQYFIQVVEQNESTGENSQTGIIIQWAP